jgi:hypothetical protein
MSYCKAILLALGSFFLPIQPLLLLVGIFILSDTILGVWAAYKGGEEITSRKLSGIIPKMLLYQAAVLVGYTLDYFLVSEFTLLVISVKLLMTKLIAMTLIFIEVLSINENFEVITNKNLFKEFKSLLSRSSKLKAEVKELIPDKDGE